MVVVEEALSLSTSSKLVHAEIDAVLHQAAPNRNLHRMLSAAIAQAGGGEPPVLSRSFFTLLVCQVLGGVAARAAPAAAGLEFFAAALDIFDDCEDQDTGEALWRQYGQAQALNAATALLMLAQLATARLRYHSFEERVVARAMQTVASAGMAACNGQQDDLDWEARSEVTEASYFAMTRLKSASLVECACTLGALLASAEDRVVDSFGAFGRYFGVAAQINNDVLSLNHKSDIARRKKTLPVIYALSHAQPEDRTRLRAVYREHTAIDAGTAADVLDILRRSGAIHYSVVQVELHKQKALRALERAGVDASAIHTLQETLAT